MLSRSSRAPTDVDVGARTGAGAGGNDLEPRLLGSPSGEGKPEAPRVLEPGASVWQRVGNIWRSRELLVYLVRKELKVKYKDSALGFLWSMLNPAMMLFVYYFVFQVVLKNGIPLFAIFLMCGLLVWNLFQTAVPSATTSIVANAGIVKKVAFSRELLAVAAVGAALVFFFLQAIVLVIAMLIVRTVPAWGYLPLLVPALVALLVFTSALAVFLSAMNVYFRDTEHLMQVILMAWFWGTPIVYAYKTVAKPLSEHHVLWLYFLNPITPIVLTFQRALYAKVDRIQTTAQAVVHQVNGKTITTVHNVGTVVPMLPGRGEMWYLVALLAVIGASAALFLGSLHVFGRLEGNFAEEL